jgi:AcrR family transcriptional regulator
VRNQPRQAGPIDRRVARTRALLQQAHLSLIVEKGYEATTVEDICAAANVGRSTFYAHYKDKQDLHRRGLENLRRQLVERSTAMLSSADGDRATGFAFSLPMFEHARDHLPLYRALVGTPGAAIAMEAIRQILCDIVRAQLPAAAREVGAPHREFMVQYLVGAYLAVLTWWLDDGAKTSPQAMDAMFQRLAAGERETAANLTWSQARKPAL